MTAPHQRFPPLLTSHMASGMAGRPRSCTKHDIGLRHLLDKELDKQSSWVPSVRSNESNPGGQDAVGCRMAMSKDATVQ